jgi:antitoxin (DNA-binding transcriptional repressor) of toxin-antitoxin stability system
MKTVTLQEAQQDLAKLMILVGQGEDVLITHDTLPPVKLVASSGVSQKRLGQFLGKAQMSEDFNEPLFKTSIKVAELNQFFSQLPSLGDDGVAFAQDIQAARKQLIMTEESWD